MYVRRRLSIFFTCFVILVVTVACKSPYSSDKRVQATSFQTPMRYGRSGLVKGKVIVAPRADNFYIGPRYGKRSSNDGGMTAFRSSPYSPTSEFVVRQPDNGLACVYTGVSNIYRCDERKYPANEDLLSSN